jgi:NarL family two-component system response regulator YdfI
MHCGALIVDDDADIRLLIRLTIEAANAGLFVLGEAADGAEALAQVDELDPCVIVVDQMMPGMGGIETATRIFERRPQQVVILCSAYLDDDLRREAAAIGIHACLSKAEINRIPETVLSISPPNQN